MPAPRPEQQSIWLVVSGKCHYWPLEVESAWSTAEKAQARADSLVGDWRVAEMLVDQQEDADASTE